jgi:hypothetical protein
MAEISPTRFVLGADVGHLNRLARFKSWERDGWWVLNVHQSSRRGAL